MKLKVIVLTIFQNVILVLSIVVNFLIVIDFFNFNNNTIVAVVFTINIDQKYITSFDIIVYNTKFFVAALIEIIEFYFNF